MPLKGKNVGVEPPTYKGITSEVGWAFSPTKSKIAFTLAEVLITLGIIGVVAALTLPSLMAKHRKVQIVTSMKKFYSTFSQAVQLSQVRNGDFSQIPPPAIDHNADSLADWWEIYLRKEFKNQRTYTKNGWFLVDFADGSGAGIKSMSKTEINMQVIYCVNLRECLDKDFNVAASAGGATDGKNSFTFILYKNKLSPVKTDLSRDEYINNSQYGCAVDTGDFAHRYCSSLIMHDGWEIKDDYPVKL